MNTCIRILSVSVVAWSCMTAWSSAQVGSEGEWNLLAGKELLVPPGSYGGSDLVFRNRIGGMCFTATADILAMAREGNHSFALLQNGPGGPEALNAKDLEFEMRPGLKLNLIVHDILFGNDLELGYLAIDGYSLSKSVYGNGSTLYFNSPLGPAASETANVGDGICFNYPSRIHSAEANLRHDLGDRLSLLAGFRYADLHEQIDGTHTAAGQSDARFITANTDNHLYGFQLGGALSIVKVQKVLVTGIAKAGIYSNQSDLALFGADEAAAVGGVKGQLAFLGEVNLIGSYCITDNIAVRLGYQAMWFSGVSLAVDQLEMPTELGPPAWRPDTQGSLFYHGAFMGVEISF
jgi:hypothetical protein